MSAEPCTGVLLVADSPGHLLERIARSWQCYSGGTHGKVVCSETVPSYVRCRLAERAGLVHWLDPLGFAVCARAVRVPQIAMIYHLTDPEIPLMLRALKHADAITTISRDWQGRLEAMTGRTVTLIPSAVDVGHFHPVSVTDSMRACSGIPPGSFVVGFVGKATANANGRKGLELLEAVLLRAGGRWPDLVVLLVGPGWEALGERLGRARVQVVRRAFTTSEETASCYPLMDALLVTSTDEGGPYTVLEAMACGVPVVTTCVGHVPEVVTHGVTSFIAAPDAEAFMVSLTLIRNGGQPMLALRARAREFIVSARDERRLIPQVDFARVYDDAVATFAIRTRRELAVRSANLMRLAGRFAARSLMRRRGAGRVRN